MTWRFLLDTSIVSAPVAKVPNAELLRTLAEQAEQCVIAAPVWHELVYGCERLPMGRKRRALEAFLEEVVMEVFPILPYDQAAAHWHGVERARLAGLGTPAPFVDGQIAAIASTNTLTLVTRNVRDFERFTGLNVEDWSQG